MREHGDGSHSLSFFYSIKRYSPFVCPFEALEKDPCRAVDASGWSRVRLSIEGAISNLKFQFSRDSHAVCGIDDIDAIFFSNT